jgi:hypothetical protein
VRRLVILVLTACGSSGPPAPIVPNVAVAPVAPPARTPPADRAPIDPMTALVPAAGQAVSLLQPGAIQLELHATPIDGPGPALPIPVLIVAEQGSRVRVAVRLPHARFLVWTERARLFALLLRDETVAEHAGGGGMPSDKTAILRAGAPVQRLAHKDAWTQVRFSGAVEIEGWVPDATLGEASPAPRSNGRFHGARRTQMAMPGTVIRAEPRWGTRQLAVMANGYYLEAVRDIDDAWSEIAYNDNDVALTGYVSKRDPPGRVNRKRPDPSLAPPPVLPNTTVASGTCLHARVDGEPIGYVVGDAEVDLVDAGRSWWTITINTPWGPIPFAARGPDPTTLVTCTPDKTVPAAKLVAPSVP